MQAKAAEIYRELGCKIEVDALVKGARTRHKIDVWAIFNFGGIEYRVDIECKYWNTRVKKIQVSSLLGVDPHSTELYNFKAVYSMKDSKPSVEFYVDGNLGWKSPYINIFNREFYLVLTSHKLSPENVNIGRNYIRVDKASMKNSEDNFLNFMRQNIQLPVLIIFVSNLAYFLYIYLKEKSINKELKELEEERKELETRFFKRIIDEKTFNALKKDINEKMLNLEIKKKLRGDK